MNIGEPWPDSDAARWRVLEMQTKLHQWATDDPKRRFDDLYNLVYDPAFLVVAWERVRGELVPGVSMLGFVDVNIDYVFFDIDGFFILDVVIVVSRSRSSSSSSTT